MYWEVTIKTSVDTGLAENVIMERKLFFFSGQEDLYNVVILAMQQHLDVERYEQGYEQIVKIELCEY